MSCSEKRTGVDRRVLCLATEPQLAELRKSPASWLGRTETRAATCVCSDALVGRRFTVDVFMFPIERSFSLFPQQKINLEMAKVNSY